jgi:hypothetical protein
MDNKRWKHNKETTSDNAGSEIQVEGKWKYGNIGTSAIGDTLHT